MKICVKKCILNRNGRRSPKICCESKNARARQVYMPRHMVSNRHQIPFAAAVPCLLSLYCLIRPSFSSPLLFIPLLGGSQDHIEEVVRTRLESMEGGKKPSSSIADELFPTGKYAPPPSSTNFSSSSPGYFSSVFPPASSVRTSRTLISPSFLLLCDWITKLRFFFPPLKWCRRFWANLRAIRPKHRQCGARTSNLSRPVDLKNRPTLARPFTTAVGISMTALHPTNHLELQNL